MAARRRVAWTPRARRSLNEAVAFISDESEDGARRVLEQALSAAKSLATLSERGRVVPEVGDSAIREVFVYRYRLMYRVTSDTVEIVAFIHGSRDFSGLGSTQ